MLPAYLFATRVLKPGNDDMHHAGLRGSERRVENFSRISENRQHLHPATCHAKTQRSSRSSS